MTQREIEVDVAVIGAGSAGLVARRQAHAHGAGRVLLIEGGALGTTCARVGCMPSKLLIAAAEAAARMREAGVFGVTAEQVHIDGAEVMARVQRERDRFVSFAVAATEDPDAGELLRGWARFVGPHSLVVECESEQVRVEARAIVLATGSTPAIAPPLRGLGPRLLTSDEVFELPTLPRSLVVVGAGVLGLELGSAMHRLGVETRVLDIATRLPLLRSDVMQARAHALFCDQLDLRLGIFDLQAQAHANGVTLRWTEDETRHEVECEYVLAATGRRPQLERLELANAGIELDERGMPRGWDETTTQIADAPIFMAGDVANRRPLLHEASAEGRIAGANAARWPDVRAHARQTSLALMFTDPEVAVVGQVPDPASEGTEWEAGEVDYARQGRARMLARARGHARIYARRDDGTLLGAELIGPDVEHLAHLLAWSIEQGLTVQRALELPYYHPTLEEGLRTAFADLAKRIRPDHE